MASHKFFSKPWHFLSQQSNYSLIPFPFSWHWELQAQNQAVLKDGAEWSKTERILLSVHVYGSLATMPSFLDSEEIDLFLTKRRFNLVSSNASVQKSPSVSGGWVGRRLQVLYSLVFRGISCHSGRKYNSCQATAMVKQRCSHQVWEWVQSRCCGSGLPSQALSQLEWGRKGERGGQQKPSSCLSHIIFSSVRLLCD